MSVEKFTLGELCTIEKGSTGILKAIPGDYPLVVTGEDRKSHNEFQFDNEAVIIPLVSGTGHGHASIKRIHFQTGKFALGSILCAVIPKDKSKLNAEYLHYFLDLNRENELVTRMRGMANVTLPMKEIAKIEIPLPSFDDQIQFVKMYKLLGEKSNDLSIELSHQLNLLKKLRQQLLKDAIQGKLMEQDLNDQPASVLLQKIKAEKEDLIKGKKLKKEKDLPEIKPKEVPFEIPANWVWCRLGDICSHISDIDHSMPKAVKNGGVKFLSAKDLLDNGTINYTSEIKYISETDFLRLGRKIIPQINDIIYSRIGARLGKARVVESKERFIVSYSCCTIRTLNPNVRYLNFLMDCGFVLNQATSKTTNNSIPDLGIQKIKEFLIPLPPLSEQKKIEKKIQAMLQICDSLETSIQQSQQQNEQLLKQVLREALTKSVKQEEQVIAKDYVELKEDEKYRALLLAAEIVWQLNQQQTLGRIKLQKLIYLCQRTQKMNLPLNFLKWAMGPYDPVLQKYIEKEMWERKWFSYNEDEPLKFKPLENSGQHRADFDDLLANEKFAINHLIQLFENSRSAKIEIVATLFACWEEILFEHQLLNDVALLSKFYNWSDKKKKYKSDKVIEALRWMEVHGITPVARKNIS